eukprot:607572-Alexandrium_andersonii.AAC.1
MSASLVGSEMCIRDRFWTAPNGQQRKETIAIKCFKQLQATSSNFTLFQACLLYTSDAADDM